MKPDPDAIADCVLSTFDQLPDRRKPRNRFDGTREWVPLAGIVLAKDGRLTCVSLGTGMKCLPQNKLAMAQGNILHDWHAEIVALRSFNRFLVDECLLLCTTPRSISPYIQRRSPEQLSSPTHQQPFTVRDDVEIHMYCSEAPCGDASMELTMQAQDDATPWTSAPPVVQPASTSTPNATLPESLSPAVLRGRSHFAHLGAVRCKPSRPDAPPTLSKSCSDKLALTQATSTLAALTSLLISPENAYMQSLVLPASQVVPAACDRSFGEEGRMSGVTGKMVEGWTGGYVWRGLEARGTAREFAWSRRNVGTGEKAVASNLSTLWTPRRQETLIGGVLQGRKQTDARGASAICRRSMWRSVVEVAGLVGAPALVEALHKSCYREVKEGELLNARRKVKDDVRSGSLRGWVRNTGDEDFGDST